MAVQPEYRLKIVAEIPGVLASTPRRQPKKQRFGSKKTVKNGYKNRVRRHREGNFDKNAVVAGGARTNYAGADWMQEQLNALHKLNDKKHPEITLSSLGRKVADLLGDWQRGIYHLDQKELFRADWENTFCVYVSMHCSSMATFDFDDLTRLVFLAHDMALRVQIEPSTHHHMRILFHERTHGGSETGIRWHPTLEEAVRLFRQTRADGLSINTREEQSC